MPLPQTPLRSRERRMVFDVYSYFLKNNSITDSLNKTVEATKRSLSTVKRIVRESKSSEYIVKFTSPGKKRERTKPITGIDDFDKGVIKRIIHNFHKTENVLPTIGKLRAKLREDINFEGSEKSLRSIVKELGFKWKATENNRKVLIETSAIRLLRINYLQKLRQYRQQNRPIVYTDESYVHSSHAKPKGWADGSTKGLKKPISKGQRVVIVHAGSETGFVPSALLTFKSGMKSGDYHDDMNFDNYEKWIRTQLLPNLAPNSVIVVDNAPYHNKEYDLAPNSNARKAEMQAWLTDKQITFSPEMLKPQLYQLIKSNKDRFKTFSVDKIFKEHNHDVLRLPPYHPDLNPIEMAWATIKAYVGSKNIQWNVPRVIELVNEKVNAMGPSDWKKLCDKVRTIEEAYLKSDHVIDEMTEEFIIRVGDADSSDADSNSDSSDVKDNVATPGPSSSAIKEVNYVERVSDSD